jgi:hypothetical protein
MPRLHSSVVCPIIIVSVYFFINPPKTPPNPPFTGGLYNKSFSVQKLNKYLQSLSSITIHNHIHNHIHNQTQKSQLSNIYKEHPIRTSNYGKTIG